MVPTPKSDSDIGPFRRADDGANDGFDALRPANPGNAGGGGIC